MSRRFASLLVLAATLFAGSTAYGEGLASEEATPPAWAGDPTFRYFGPAPKLALRASLEIAGLLALGFAQYAATKETNSVDWDLAYDWPSFRSKLVGDSIVLDTNRFDTNYLTHPGSGTLYYLAARGNRLNVLESFGLAVGASMFWEYVGEFREQVSLNDVIVTPIAGLALGETATQLGAFFDRGCKTLPNQALGALFGPSRTLHDAIDGLSPWRETRCDKYGLPRAGYHKLRLFVGAGATAKAAAAASPYQDLRFAFDAHVVNLDAYDHPGVGWTTFAESNASEIDAAVTFSRGSVSDGGLAVRTAPIGAYGQSIREHVGGRLVGNALLVGAEVGAEYAQHDYDRDRDDRLDRIFLLDIAGGVAEWTSFLGAARLRLALHASVGYGAVDPFAVGSAARGTTPSWLPPVTRAAGYYHARVVNIAPRLRFEAPSVAVGAELRFARFDSLSGLNRRADEGIGEVALDDERLLVRAWLSYAPMPGPLRLTALAEARTRRGHVADARATVREASVAGGVGLTF